jgi:non-specific serine/threonine protein kinase
VPSYWTVKKSKCVRFITKKHGGGKIHSVTRKQKLLSDALLDENHISPEIEENLDFILA